MDTGSLGPIRVFASSLVALLPSGKLMNTKKFNLAFAIAIALLTQLLPSSIFAQEKVDFVTQIKPIFEQHCMECHGPEDDGNGFRIDDKDDAFGYLVEENSEDSEIYLVTVSDDEDAVMPPPDYEHQLSDKKKELIKQWIDEGAAWPDDAKFVKYEGEATPDANQEDKTGESKSTEEKMASESGSTQEEAAVEEAKEEANPLDPRTDRILKATATLHPAVVHLPIGLLLASGLFALLSLRGNFVMSDCAYYCLWLGSIGAILACVTGWFWSPMEMKGTVNEFQDIFDTSHKVYWHRIGGLGVAIFSFILALFAASARSRDPDEGAAWKLGAILLAAAVGWVGHTGGELHYPKSHFKHLEALWEDLTGDKVDEEEAPGEDALPSEEEDEDDTSKVGTTSGE